MPDVGIELGAATAPGFGRNSNTIKIHLSLCQWYTLCIYVAKIKGLQISG